MRSRYYVLWMISQLIVDLAGLSWNQKTQAFNLYQNAKPVEIELITMDAKTRVSVGDKSNLDMEYGSAKMASINILRKIREETRKEYCCSA